ncbi:regulator of sigma E protease [Lachnospiraceae bacterium]|nr:regulator of sigma E protease [Lachnospiraceae bacterium]
MQIILFLLIFTVIILVHEGGHFIIGKKSGIGVVEFSLGLGPTIWGIERGGTKYSIKALPFGGACQFEGFDGDELDSSPTSFVNASVWARIATVFAGPFMNFVLAFFLSLFVVGSIGYDAPVISQVMEDYPAAKAGLREGDEIVKVGSDHIAIYRDISLDLMLNEGEAMEITYRRDGELFKTTLTPEYNAEAGRYLFGIIGGQRVKGNPLTTIRYSFAEVRYWIEATWKSLGMIFKGKVTKDDVAGPVGVAQVVGDVYEQSKPSGIFYIWINMMMLTILLTANLGVMNLLPVPALDGGRLVFLLIEAVVGHPVNRKAEAFIHFVGMVVLLVFMFLVLFNDISKFFH